eukprot:441756-Rhodomonas_salina.2
MGCDDKIEQCWVAMMLWTYTAERAYGCGDGEAIIVLSTCGSDSAVMTECGDDVLWKSEC